MVSSLLLSIVALLWSITFTSALSANSIPSSLNITAISASFGTSKLEYWQIPGFKAYRGTPGALTLSLGELSNATYSLTPSRTKGKAHNASAAQYS
ncbi:hypothetical protein EJ08DRAFT_651273 [Tothia fuscella]|uniref:Uncharacterized protein n=1 Tax=Tothia fuscella TaxID=1048955 RepID=A0A9P4NMF3_9PEZI|nr:hypothetical protein EJ08DRAFT_651273 [Tothia fuscella]